MSTQANRKFKVGFIGAGGIAHTQARALKTLEGVEVTCAADISEKALDSMQKEQGVARVYRDYHELLREEHCDAISVCTPNGQHMPNTVAALEAGKHVIVEKPMAMNAREGRQMLDAARKAGRQLVVGFQMRFDPRTELVRRQVLNGTIGKPMYVRCQALRRRGIPNWGVFGRKDLQGGGPMIDIGVHVLEMAHYAIGSPAPVAASGNAWTYFGNRQSQVHSSWPNWDHKSYNVEDLAVGMIRFENGCMLSIEASFVAHVEKDVWGFQVMGEKGGADWETGTIFTDHDRYMMNMKPAWLPSENWDAMFVRKMRHFVEACRDGKTNESPGEHGLMVQKMLDGVYASAEAGREVVID